tara:strand:+ start:392 stop:1012 length:621 start_codon:yes stop_codon:yes gene_type:complete
MRPIDTAWGVLKDMSAVRQALESGIENPPHGHEYHERIAPELAALNEEHNSGLVPLKATGFGLGTYTHPRYPGMQIEAMRNMDMIRATARSPTRHHEGWVGNGEGAGFKPSSALNDAMHGAVHDWHRDNLPHDHPDWVAYALGVSPDVVWDEYEALHGEKMETAMAAHPNARKYNWELDPDQLEEDKYQRHPDPGYVWQPRFMEGQ